MSRFASVVLLVVFALAAFPADRVRAVPADSVLQVSARADDTALSFHLEGRAPAGADEVVLWYDAGAGRAGRRFSTSPGASIERTVRVALPVEGLGLDPASGGRLDYWWAALGDGATLAREDGVLVIPRDKRRPEQATAPTTQAWNEARTAHYVLRYYPGSPAERDIERIKTDAEAAFAQASQFISPTEALSITVHLVPRVFWQGGVAYDGSTLMVTYADRSYAGVDVKPYLVHETIHALAHGLVDEGSDVGGLVGEGIATWATGGHYGPEPIDAWAATLARSDRYVPLCRIRADFPNVQHEIAYIEGASFVGYLIRTYGLERFQRFYASDPEIPRGADRDIDAFCAAESSRPVAELGVSYDQLERDWLAYLATLAPTADESALFWGQTRFFDLVRTYEERFDPDARILPPPPRRWNARIYEAFSTPALTETNTVMESMFVAADRALDNGDVTAATSNLDEIAAMLESGEIDGAFGNDVEQVASVLRRYGRAQRLGDPALQSIVTARTFVSPSDTLWSDYRLSLQSVELDGATGIVRAERTSRALGESTGQEEGVLVRVVRQHTGWRIAAIESDPARPAQPWTPTTMPTSTNAIAYNTGFGS